MATMERAGSAPKVRCNWSATGAPAESGRLISIGPLRLPAPAGPATSGDAATATPDKPANCKNRRRGIRREVAAASSLSAEASAMVTS